MATLQDRDRDVTDYRERDRDYKDRSRNDRDDREISLGTGTILVIFFALTLLCAIFFGFGYSMGRKSVQNVITGFATQPASATGLFSGSKPSAENSGNAVHAANSPDVDGDNRDDKTSESRPDSDGQTTSNPVPTSRDRPSSITAIQTPAHQLTAKAGDDSGRPKPFALPAISPNGTAMVQVAAVSHHEDADTLVFALKKKGYAVFIRQEPQDHLLHVQVGPFATRKDADAMRLHLLADGYNAIVK